METIAMKGGGHFLLGFILGYLIFQVMLYIRPKSYHVAVYTPMIPFLLGGFFAIPYLFALMRGSELQDIIGVMVNIFGAYDWIQHSQHLPAFLGNVNLIALVYGVFFLMIVVHYIRLIKRLRAYQCYLLDEDYAG